jgi:hypothetical protein
MPAPALIPNDPAMNRAASKPVKLTWSDMVGRWKARGYSEAGARGIADNMMRESSGNPGAIGDAGSSLGLFQHHGPRKDALIAYAKDRGKPATDPDVQIDFADQELRTQYPKLRAQLATSDSRGASEDAFKRLSEKPASVMWQNKPPTLATDKYRFSDYALNEHKDRKNTDIVYMPPQDYLDLSPALETEPFKSPSGRSIKASVNRGDEIESIPSLTIKGGKVTDQDGRHRALLAQEHGIDAIPVAVTQPPGKKPTEIEGMGGKVVATSHFTPAADVPKQAATATLPHLVPDPTPIAPHSDDAWWKSSPVVKPTSAEAAPNEEADDPYAKYAAPEAEPNPFDQFDEKPTPEDKSQAKAEPMSRLQRFGEGLYQGALAAEQIAGRVLPIPAYKDGKWVPRADADDAAVAEQRARLKAGGVGPLDPYMLGGQVANPINYVGPGVLGNALKAGPAAAGALSGMWSSMMTTPVTDGGNFIAEKAKQGLGGAAAGGALGAVTGALSNAVAPTLRTAVSKLMGEGVNLTPGQMAGGVTKTMEDKAMSAPFTGDAITAARQRSFKDFNRAAWNRVLAPLGERMPNTVEMGRDAANYVSDRVTDAYQRIIPHLRLANVHNDATFVQDLGDAVQHARDTLPEAQFRQVENVVRSQILEKLGNAGTTADGELINGIDSMLGSEVRGYKGDPLHDNRKMGEVFAEVQIAYRDLMARQNPQFKDELNAAREAYANYVRVGRAAASSGTAKTEGIFSPAQLNIAVRAEDRTSRKMGYSKQQALLQDLSDAGASVLPSSYPDSGTAGRQTLNHLLGAGALGSAAWFHNPILPLAMLAGAAPYTPPASRLTNALVNRIAQRPGPTRNALAEILRRTGPVLAPATQASIRDMVGP